MKLSSDLTIHSSTHSLGGVTIQSVSRDLGNAVIHGVEHSQSVTVTGAFRYRLLSDMDDSALSVYDSNDLFFADYVEVA